MAVDLSQIPLFALADQRLAWVAGRQSVLASNIANANTPGWRSKDTAPFASLLAREHVGLAQTAPGHLGGTVDASLGTATVPGERSPDGNSVALDRELAKVADTDMAHEIAISLTHSYVGMFRTAIGK